MRALLVLLLVGCGTQPPGFELRDGDRLKLRYWAYDDGTRQWDPQAYFDATLGAECRPIAWSDGHTYCTPMALVISYRDAACTEAVGRSPAAEPVPTVFRRDYVFDARSSVSRMFVPTAPRGVLSRVWIFDGSKCVGPFEDDGQWRYFDVEEMPMVRMFENAPIGDGRVQAIVTTTDDGLQAPTGLRDTVLDAACEPRAAADGAVTCHPRGASEALYFREPTCTSDHALAFDDAAEVPRVARIVGDDACETYLSVGDEILSYPLYGRVDGACVAADVGDHVRVFATGPLDLAPLGTVHAAGERMKTVELVDGALHVPAQTLFDQTLDSDCELVNTGDVVRCIPRPSVTPAQPYYLDPACTEYATGVRLPVRACEPTRRYSLHRSGTTLAVHELLPPLVGPHYEVVAGACVEVVTPDFRPRGPAVPLTVFAAAVHE